MAITKLDTSALTNQTIATALLACTYSNTGEGARVRKVYVNVELAQVLGGDYAD